MTEPTVLADHRPHIHGPVVCHRCEHRWIAVRPASAKWLECPQCGSLRGGSLELYVSDPAHLLGDECCGQRDQDGKCAAPACIRGDALKLIKCVRALLA